MKALLVVAVVLCVINAKVDWPVEQCGTDSDVLVFDSAVLSAAPTKGSTNEINLFGTAEDHIEFSEVTLTAKLNGIPV